MNKLNKLPENIPEKFILEFDKLSKDLDIKIERGPEELKDLPTLFGGKALKYDLITNAKKASGDHSTSIDVFLSMTPGG